MDSRRLEAFSDGVFAIIITIMVLELKVPHGESVEDLWPVLPAFLSYALSFVYIGIYWNNHHHMYPHSTQVGTLIAHVNDLAIIGYAVVLFTVLKRWNEALALGYVAFKALEATLLGVGGAMLLSLIGLSQQYLQTGPSDPGYFEATATLALSQQFWAARLAALAYVVATPILNALLYRSQIVPRFISVWGFVAVLLLATGLAIGVGDPTRGFQPGQLLVIPIILWELLFATWLMVRGFGPSVAPADPWLAEEVRPLVPAST